MNVRKGSLSAWVVNLAVLAAIPAAIGLAAALRPEEVTRITAAPEDPDHAEHCEVCAWRYRPPGPLDASEPLLARRRRPRNAQPAAPGLESLQPRTVARRPATS